MSLRGSRGLLLLLFFVLLLDLRHGPPTTIRRQRFFVPLPSTKTVPAPARGKRSRLLTKTSSLWAPERGPERASGQTLGSFNSRHQGDADKASSSSAPLFSLLFVELGRVTRRRSSRCSREGGTQRRKKAMEREEKALEKAGALSTISEICEVWSRPSTFHTLTLLSHSVLSALLSNLLFIPPSLRLSYFYCEAAASCHYCYKDV